MNIEPLASDELKLPSVPQRLGEGLRRVYKVASQPFGGEPLRPPSRETFPVEYYASLAARIVALPLVALRETFEVAGAAKQGAPGLQAGPRGEGDEWTPDQIETAANAFMTAGAAVVGGGPGAGTGVASIGRKDALKSFAKSFRKQRSPYTKAQREGIKEVASLYNLSEDAMVKMGVPQSFTKGAEATYREMAKAFHNVPQSKLDLVDEVKLMSEGQAFAGFFRPKTKAVEINLKQSPAGVADVVGHEMTHAIQAVKDPKMTSMTMETHAYSVGPKIAGAIKELPKGKRLTNEDWDRIYGESLKGLEGVGAKEAPTKTMPVLKSETPIDKFDELAGLQRNKPEAAMVKAQMTMGGGVLNPVVEHAGDLIHRMSQTPSFYKGGFEWVKSKVNTVHRYLHQDYGFEKELSENIRNNARFRNISPDVLKEDVSKALTKYAGEHKKLPTYNKAQKLANDLAIAIGEQKWDDARSIVTELKRHTDLGEDHWSKFALKGGD